MTKSARFQLNHPVVLVHGLGAKAAFGPFDYFHDWPARLKKQGNAVFVPDLTFWNTIDHRAQKLKDQLEAQFPDPNVKLNLIGHSMGGLDARFLTSALKFYPRVASVTTVGTPNRGSVLGDIAAGVLKGDLLHLTEKPLRKLGWSNAGMLQLTREYAQGMLARAMPDIDGIRYFSATSVIKPPLLKTAFPLFWLPHQIISHYEGEENDGFVSLSSAKWGHHICTHVGDHYAQIGHFVGHTRGLDHLKFYDEIIGHLKAEDL